MLKILGFIFRFSSSWLLAEAGGGGGSNESFSGNRDPIDPRLPAPAKISKARPVPGSVTHSSNTNGILTSDKIQVVSNEDGSYNVIKNGNDFGKVTEGTNNYLETSTTNLVSNLYKYPDGSYMLHGTWSERKPNGSLSIDNLFVGDVGVFVDSTEYKGSISQLTGTATYEDNVKFTKYNTNSNYYRSLCGTSCEGFSLYEATTETEAKRLIDIHKRYNDGFAIGNTLEGNMILKADFEDTNSLGYVSGEINNFKDKQIVSYESIGTSNNPNYALTFDTVNLPGKLNLDRLSIGSTHNGFFDGDLNGYINSRRYNGKWGGQFYSYDANYTHPTNIAGTLAASSGNFNIIAPWFISNSEISTLLLPIHFKPPQENNPKIGLQPGPRETTPITEPGPGITPPTTAPSPGVTPPMDVPGTTGYGGSINGFDYWLERGPLVNTSRSIYRQRDYSYIDPYESYNSYHAVDCAHSVCPHLFNLQVEYKNENGAKWYYNHNNDKGEITSDIRVLARFAVNHDEHILEPSHMTIYVENVSDTSNLPGILLRDTVIPIRDTDIRSNGRFFRYISPDDTINGSELQVEGSFLTNSNSYNVFPNFVAGEVWYRDKTESLSVDGVFVTEKDNRFR